jgi:hypothetical protein
LDALVDLHGVQTTQTIQEVNKTQEALRVVAAQEGLATRVHVDELHSTLRSLVSEEEVSSRTNVSTNGMLEEEAKKKKKKKPTYNITRITPRKFLTNIQLHKTVH